MHLRPRTRRASWRRWAVAGCALALAACGDARDTADEPSLPVAWAAAWEADSITLTLTPLDPLRGGRVYGVVLTNGVSDAASRPLRAAETFRRLAGVAAGGDAGPVALMGDDPETEGNPYPEARLVRADGTVRVPDRVALRGVAATPAQPRAFLRSIADQIETIRGFSTTAPVRIPLSAPVDLATVTADTVRFVERRDGALDLEGLLDDAARSGVAREDIALAFSFPTQPIADDLLAIRRHLLDRAAGSPPRLVLEDDDPTDGLSIGVFDADHPGPFASVLADGGQIATAARGLMHAPSFLGPDGILDPARIAGAAPPVDVAIDVALTLPRGGSSPYPVVMLQHGFGGDNLGLLSFAEELAADGVATIAISAVAHGRRGNPAALLDSTPLQTRDIFRQTNSDQMAVVRLIEAGIDLDGDGRGDLDANRIGYFGTSLGGLLGATFIAVEGAVQTAVLNVAGGRIAQLGTAPAIRPIYSGFFAQRAGLPVNSPEFAVVLARLLDLGQQGMDAGDGLNYARHWHREPFGGGAAKRVLLQEGIGDDWVLNENTEELARVAGIAAQQPDADPAGVCGLWRFDPPDPPRGHSIRQRPEVRAQAIHFLMSGGTLLVDPAAEQKGISFSSHR